MAGLDLSQFPAAEGGWIGICSRFLLSTKINTRVYYVKMDVLGTGNVYEIASYSKNTNDAPPSNSCSIPDMAPPKI